MMGVVLLGCSHHDPIDRLMDTVSNEGFSSYMFVPIKLSETASPEQCISNLTSRGDFQSPKILKTRQVHTSLENYTAVLLDTDAGQKIVLLHPEKTNAWYYKIYDAK